MLDSIHSVICGSAAFVKVSAWDGTPIYAYQWSSGQTTPTISPTTGGIYTVVVHDGVGCVDSESFLINNPAFPNTYFDLNTNFVNTGSLAIWPSSPIGLDAFNDGCVSQTGTVKMVLDSLLSYYSAYPAPSQVIGDTVVWNFSNLNYNTPHFKPHVTVNPIGNIGDTVCVTSIIDPITGDANPSNNVKTSCYIITGSWDPNDITVYPQGACDLGYVLPNTTFTYTIDFQNTGNAAASNIYVLDSLDSDLDLNTAKVVGSSHNMYTEVLAGNVLKFHFDNINLPDMGTNDSASHGYVIFQIKSKNSITMGSLVKNHAAIYFDNNPPIITNEVFNKVVATIPNCATSIKPVDKSSFHLSPNPFNEIFTIICPSAKGTIMVFDATGKEVVSLRLSKPKTIIDMKGYSSEVYFVKYEDGEVCETVKVVKE